MMKVGDRVMVRWGLTDEREAVVVEPKTFLPGHVRVIFSDDDSTNICDHPGCDYDYGPAPVLLSVEDLRVKS